MKEEIEKKKKAEKDAAKMKKKLEDIKKINDEVADADVRVKTANEKKEFWKAKAASIKNATEMEKEEKEQDEKDYQEMKEAVPGVAKRVIDRVKGDIAADQKLANDKIKAWNKRVLSSAPSHRAPEPVKKEDEKDPETAASDSAVDEKKASAKAAEPEYKKTMYPQVASVNERTDKFGNS